MVPPSGQIDVLPANLRTLAALISSWALPLALRYNPEIIPKKILTVTGVLLLSAPAFGAKKKDASLCQDDLKSLAEALSIQHKGNDAQKEAWDNVREVLTKIKETPDASAEIANVGFKTAESAQIALGESGKHSFSRNF